MLILSVRRSERPGICRLKRLCYSLPGHLRFRQSSLISIESLPFKISSMTHPICPGHIIYTYTPFPHSTLYVLYRMNRPLHPIRQCTSRRSTSHDFMLICVASSHHLDSRSEQIHLHDIPHLLTPKVVKRHSYLIRRVGFSSLTFTVKCPVL